jgi:hypothetical protein
MTKLTNKFSGNNEAHRKHLEALIRGVYAANNNSDQEALDYYLAADLYGYVLPAGKEIPSATQKYIKHIVTQLAQKPENQTPETQDMLATYQDLKNLLDNNGSDLDTFRTVITLSIEAQHNSALEKACALIEEHIKTIHAAVKTTNTQTPGVVLH